MNLVKIIALIYQFGASGATCTGTTALGQQIFRGQKVERKIISLTVHRCFKPRSSFKNICLNIENHCPFRHTKIAVSPLILSSYSHLVSLQNQYNLHPEQNPRSNDWCINSSININTQRFYIIILYQQHH